MSIGPPRVSARSLLFRPGSQPTTSAWTFPCCADKLWCLACGCERCNADPLPTVVISATASSVPPPAPPVPEPLPSVASVPPPRWPPPPTELPPSVPQQASPEAQLLPAGKHDDQPKPWIISCRDCDDPEQAEVCPRCDLPRCQSCGNQGLCCNSPEAQSGRQRLQERQSDSATGGYGDPEAIGGPTNDLQRLCGIDGHRCQQCLCLALLKGGAPCCFGNGPKTHDDGPPLSHAFFESVARGWRARGPTLGTWGS